MPLVSCFVCASDANISGAGVGAGAGKALDLTGEGVDG